jgi:hypothetical protein
MEPSQNNFWSSTKYVHCDKLNKNIFVSAVDGKIQHVKKVDTILE